MKKLSKEQSNKWFSNDNRVLWRLQKDIFSSPMKPVTVGDVEDCTKRAIEFISRIAGAVPTTLPKLSPVVFKDYDVVLMLLEISHSVSLMGKVTSEAFDYLIKEEQELGIELAKAALEAVHNDFQAGSNGKTLPTLRNADATRTRNLRIDSPMLETANPSFPAQKHGFSPHSDKQLVSGLFSVLENDSDLKLIVKAWPELPEHIKVAIKTLVQTQSKEKSE